MCVFDGVVKIFVDGIDCVVVDWRWDVFECGLDDDVERGETFSRGRERRRVCVGGV